MYYISIDIESTGLNIFAIGVSIYKYNDVYDFNPIHIEDKLLVSKFDINNFDQTTYNEFWCNHIEILNDLSKKINCEDEKDLINNFFNYFINFIKDIDEKIYIISDYTSFDIGSLDSLIKQYNISDKQLLYQKHNLDIIDTSSYTLGVSNMLNIGDISNLHILLKKLNCRYEFDINHDHNPLNDSKLTVLEYLKLKNIMYKITHSKLKLIC